MGTEFITGSRDEPAFDIEGDVHAVLDHIGGWSYLFRLARADYDRFDAIVAPDNLEDFVAGCEVLAEEYGVPTRRWGVDAAGEMPAWTVSGTDLRDALGEMVEVARRAHASHAALTIRNDYEWPVPSWWQSDPEKPPF
jgi:hypothetical protein